MENNIKFADGLVIKPPHEKAPDFVKGHISIKRKDLGNWLRGQSSDWINLDIKVSKSGKWYASVNEWKPGEEKKPKEKKQDESDSFEDDDIPF